MQKICEQNIKNLSKDRISNSALLSPNGAFDERKNSVTLTLPLPRILIFFVDLACLILVPVLLTSHCSG
jgi:hypothetical protein